MNELEIQFGIIHDCMRGTIYGDFLGRKELSNSAWPSIMDMCYADAIISWNQVFGQRSQDTHWSKFVKKLKLPEGTKLKPFTKQIILDYLEITDEEWKIYHCSMVKMRNIRIAHINISESLDVPNTTWALHCCYIYREWLIQALHILKENGLDIKITEDKSKQVLLTFKEQINNSYNGL